MAIVKDGETPLVRVGKVIAAQGLGGEVRIYPESDFPERFLRSGRRWLLRPGQQEPEAMKLVRGRVLEGKGLFVVQFAEVSDRSGAEALVGAEMFVLASDRPRLEEDEFHVGDLIGLQVFDQDTQTLVGTVVSVIPAGNDLLEVERAEGDRVLIPFVWAIVPVVDLAQSRIEITPPVGLIE